MDTGNSGVSKSSNTRVFHTATQSSSVEPRGAQATLAESRAHLHDMSSEASGFSNVEPERMVNRKVKVEQQMTRLHLNPRKFTTYSEDAITSENLPGKLEDARTHSKKIEFLSKRNESSVDDVKIECSLDGFNISNQTLPGLIEYIRSEVENLATLSHDLYPSVLSQRRFLDQLGSYSKTMQKQAALMKGGKGIVGKGSGNAAIQKQMMEIQEGELLRSMGPLELEDLQLTHLRQSKLLIDYGWKKLEAIRALLQDPSNDKDNLSGQILANNYEQYIKDMLELLRMLLIEDVASQKYKTTDVLDCDEKGERCGYTAMELVQRALDYCIENERVESLLICLSTYKDYLLLWMDKYDLSSEGEYSRLTVRCLLGDYSFVNESIEHVVSRINADTLDKEELEHLLYAFSRLIRAYTVPFVNAYTASLRMKQFNAVFTPLREVIETIAKPIGEVDAISDGAYLFIHDDCERLDTYIKEVESVIEERRREMDLVWDQMIADQQMEKLKQQFKKPVTSCRSMQRARRPSRDTNRAQESACSLDTVESAQPEAKHVHPVIDEAINQYLRTKSVEGIADMLDVTAQTALSSLEQAEFRYALIDIFLRDLLLRRNKCQSHVECLNNVEASLDKGELPERNKVEPEFKKAVVDYAEFEEYLTEKLEILQKTLDAFEQELLKVSDLPEDMYDQVLAIRAQKEELSLWSEEFRFMCRHIRLLYRWRGDLMSEKGLMGKPSQLPKSVTLRECAKKLGQHSEKLQVLTNKIVHSEHGHQTYEAALRKKRSLPSSTRLLASQPTESGKYPKTSSAASALATPSTHEGLSENVSRLFSAASVEARSLPTIPSEAQILQHFQLEQPLSSGVAEDASPSKHGVLTERGIILGDSPIDLQGASIEAQQIHELPSTSDCEPLPLFIWDQLPEIEQARYAKADGSALDTRWRAPVQAGHPVERFAASLQRPVRVYKETGQGSSPKKSFVAYVDLDKGLQKELPSAMPRNIVSLTLPERTSADSGVVQISQQERESVRTEPTEQDRSRSKQPIVETGIQFVLSDATWRSNVKQRVTGHLLHCLDKANNARGGGTPKMFIGGSFSRKLQGRGDDYNDIDLYAKDINDAQNLFGHLQLCINKDQKISSRIKPTGQWRVKHGYHGLEIPSLVQFPIYEAEGEPKKKLFEIEANLLEKTVFDEYMQYVDSVGAKEYTLLDFGARERKPLCLSFRGEVIQLIKVVAKFCNLYLAGEFDLNKEIVVPRTIIYSDSDTKNDRDIRGSAILMRATMTLHVLHKFEDIFLEAGNNEGAYSETDELFLDILRSIRSLGQKISASGFFKPLKERMDEWISKNQDANILSYISMLRDRLVAVEAMYPSLTDSDSNAVEVGTVEGEMFDSQSSQLTDSVARFFESVAADAESTGLPPMPVMTQEDINFQAEDIERYDIAQSMPIACSTWQEGGFAPDLSMQSLQPLEYEWSWAGEFEPSVQNNFNVGEESSWVGGQMPGTQSLLMTDGSAEFCETVHYVAIPMFEGERYIGNRLIPAVAVWSTGHDSGAPSQPMPHLQSIEEQEGGEYEFSPKKQPMRRHSL